ncbi:acyltransferase family protein [Apibacter sp.]|uniref:acyltransferase family protein n=1 Tax=Apibacter sp. TaxID=2023709 RepID=UPI0025F07D8F|nr:acyltransferase family protein [Apibacter sp.]MCT6870120.1 acyltransferase family protein [Apibacter sp.]
MNRNKIFDSLKFILVCFVVYAHTTESQYNKDRGTEVLVSFLSTFTMPLFIFISGYFSKTITWDKYKKSFKTLFLTYIVAQLTYSIPLIIAHSINPPSNQFNIFEEIISIFILPKGGLWYIVGLLVWRFMIYYIAKFKLKFALVFSLSLIIPLLFGFIDIQLNAFRIITFFPYFILGYYCTENIFNKIRKVNPLISFAVLLIIFIGLCFYKDLFHFLMATFGEGSYKATYPTVFQGFLYRASFYLISMISINCVMNLATDRFYKLGKYSLGIFLVHPCIIFTISGIRMYLLPPIEVSYPILFEFPMSMVIVGISLYLSELKPIQYWINPSLILSKK